MIVASALPHATQRHFVRRRGGVVIRLPVGILASLPARTAHFDTALSRLD
jgi:hypothetical protein